jgi:hypothetical protein
MRELTEQQVEQALREAQGFFKEQAGDDEATLLDTLVGEDEYRHLLACPTDRLAAFIDGRVPGEEHRRIEAHLKVCPFCREEEKETRALVAAWRREKVLGTLWRELREALAMGSEWAQVKWGKVRTVVGEEAAVRVGGAVPSITRAEMQPIKAIELDENWQEQTEEFVLVPEPDGAPRFTAAGIFTPGTFTAKFTLQPYNPRLEGRTVALTLQAEEQPIVTFTGELRREQETTLVVEFYESDIEGMPECSLPSENIEARILPPAEG